MPIPQQIEKAIFDVALQLEDTAIREAFLDQACSGSPDLRQRVRELLAVSEPAADFFRTSPIKEALGTEVVAKEEQSVMQLDVCEDVGAAIGNYRIIQRLG